MKGVLPMAEKRKMDRETALRRLGELAQTPVNDAVKLAFLEHGEQVDRLNLDALAEFRRSDKGAVEIRLVDRAAIWRELATLTDRRESNRMEEFFQALEE